MKKLSSLVLTITLLLLFFTTPNNYVTSTVIITNEKENGNLVSDNDKITIITPKPIPKVSRAEKEALIRASGQDPNKRGRHSRLENIHKKRGRRSPDIFDPNTPWRRNFILPKRTPIIKKGLLKPLQELKLHKCPKNFDAVTQSKDNITYAFAGDYVYQVWRDYGIPQKAAYKINDLFPGGPRTVDVALTNFRSGVMVLIQRNKVYRYRYNKKSKRFYLGNKSPQQLTEKITFLPKIGLQWIDGNIVLFDHGKFATYDPYWNLSTFSADSEPYFPGMPKDIIGMVYKNPSTLLLYTKSNRLAIYDTTVYKVVEEFPIKVEEYVACLTKSI
ncbi:Hemopexin-like domain and Hemopexin-like repeats-containing protein [Strongyloides ratti]|uniref:Hemopexin-like domain and Hemopexin-like repeats-containing protein n=1 Tax=Strongyloides ratti TaxID=34506 RepID=A0A090MUB2_STRRB|nr:Hemopexin-like domain and Hemopexin-like repeats-containing protein [Strongyloides ratti]CEF62123.1 Hemopexin-like domain and Hemopexin-like repeats-containing protein [Strongyloides ratti]